MNTELVPLLLIGGVIATLVMLGVWVVQHVRRDATLVDVAWAANLAVLAIVHASLSDGLLARRILLAAVVGAWGLRLASWLFFTRAVGKPEDGRYRTLRERWGRHASRNFLFFFAAQALLDVVLSIPSALIATNDASELSAFEIAGAALALFAIGGETLADVQLQRFKRKPQSKGRTCREGLWSVSRHPNYFFETLVWVGIATMAWPAPHGWIGLIGPTLILTLIWNVTGIPATEAHALATRGDDYREYQRTTSVFVPWFRRRS